METDAHVPAGGHSDIKRIPIDQSFCRTRNFPFLQAFDDLQRKDPQLRPRFREALSSLVVLGPGAVLRGRRARFSFSCQAQAEIKYTRKMPFFLYVAHCSSSSTVDPAFSTRPPPPLPWSVSIHSAQRCHLLRSFFFVWVWRPPPFPIELAALLVTGPGVAPNVP